eukprot:396812_1
MITLANNELFYWLLFVWIKSILFGALLGFIMCFICYCQCRTSPTNRWHWFEIHDQSWCPNVFKEYLRRILYEMVYKDGLRCGESLGEILLPIINEHNVCFILDLCSGTGGPSTIINRRINKHNPTKQIITVLTDLFPQLASWKVFAASNPNILYSSTPIDATNMDHKQIQRVLHDTNPQVFDNQLITCRTIFGAFHHFKPNLAIKIFEDAFRNSDLMIICDGFPNRSFIDFVTLSMLFIVLLPWGTLKCIHFWLFEDVDSYLIKRVIYCLSVVLLYGLCLFGIIHDAVVSLARFWDETSLREMSQSALNNINDGKEMKVNYECKWMELNTKDMISIDAVKEHRSMPTASGSLFVCVPVF